MRTQTQTRRLYRLLGLVAAGWSLQSLSAVDVTWNKMTASGLHIASNATGRPWLIGLDRASESGYSIYCL